MGRLSSVEEKVLEILIRGNALSVGDAENLVQDLRLHQVKDPHHTVTDLLIERGYLKPAQVNALLAKAESAVDKTAVRPPAPPTRRAPRNKGALRPPARSRAPLPVAQSSSAGLVAAILLVGALLIAGGGFFLLRQKNSVSDVPVTTDNEVAGSPQTQADVNGPPSMESAAAARERMRFADNSAVEANLAAALKIADSRKRFEELRSTRKICNDAQLNERIDHQIKLALMALDRDAEAALLRKEFALKRARESKDHPAVIATYKALLDEFGTRALDGKLEQHHEEAIATFEGVLASLISAGKEAYFEKRYEDADKEFRAVLAYGDNGATEDALRWVSRVEEKLGITSTQGSTKIASTTPATSKEKSGTSPATAGKLPAAEDEDEDEQPETGVVKPTKLALIQERLDELLMAKGQLDANGIIEVTYDFESKDEDEATDWQPSLLQTDLKSTVRWTLYQEETVTDGATGVRLSNTGVFRNNLKLKAPIAVDVLYHCQNQWFVKNQMALTWTDDKGDGIATNMGQQVGYVKKHKVFQLLPPRMKQIDGFRSHQLRLVIDAGSFSGKQNSIQSESRSVPEKVTSGYCGFHFDGQIAGTVRRVTLRGRLDLDWAAEKLKISPQ